MKAFAADPSPDAYADLIDRLLASPRDGERWGRHWLDVARWAEDHPTSESTNRPHPYAWRYRDWVIEAFNDDIGANPKWKRPTRHLRSGLRFLCNAVRQFLHEADQQAILRL